MAGLLNFQSQKLGRRKVFRSIMPYGLLRTSLQAVNKLDRNQNSKLSLGGSKEEWFSEFFKRRTSRDRFCWWHHPQLRDGELGECWADPTEEGLDCIFKKARIKKRILLLGCQSNLQGESTWASLDALPHCCWFVWDLTFPRADLMESFLPHRFALDGAGFSQRDNQSSVADIDGVPVLIAVVFRLGGLSWTSMNSPIRKPFLQTMLNSIERHNVTHLLSFNRCPYSCSLRCWSVSCCRILLRCVFLMLGTFRAFDVTRSQYALASSRIFLPCTSHLGLKDSSQHGL